MSSASDSYKLLNGAAQTISHIHLRGGTYGFIAHASAWGLTGIQFNIMVPDGTYVPLSYLPNSGLFTLDGYGETILPDGSDLQIVLNTGVTGAYISITRCSYD